MILQVVPFQDFHEIATLFGPLGVFGVIRKWGRSAKKIPLQPLTRVELVLKQGRGDLATVLEVSELDSYIKLRERYETLTAALECLEAVRRTQMPDQPNEALYLLLTQLLKKMGSAPHPYNFTSSLYLKILLQEGLLPEEKLTLPMTELVLSRSWSELASLKTAPETHVEVKSLFFEAI